MFDGAERILPKDRLERIAMHSDLKEKMNENG